MIAGNKWEFLCKQHGKDVKHCWAINYTSLNVKVRIQVLLNHRFYTDRFEIDDHPGLVLPKMIKYLYGILAHAFFHHSKLFNILKEKLKICER
jgi:hypothetical protein